MSRIVSCDSGGETSRNRAPARPTGGTCRHASRFVVSRTSELTLAAAGEPESPAAPRLARRMLSSPEAHEGWRDQSHTPVITGDLSMRSKRTQAKIVAFTRTNGARPRSKPVTRLDDRWSYVAMILILCLFIVVFVNSVLRRAADTLAGSGDPWSQEGP